MSKINGKYQFVKSENYIEQLVAAGMPEADAKKIEKQYITSITIEGKKITFSSSDDATHTIEDGIEKDVDGVKVSFKLDGNTLKNKRTFSAGKVWNADLVFNDNGYEELNADDNGKVFAKRIFKRV